MTPPVDATVVRRAGRLVAAQISLALAAMLILVGVVVAVVFARAQNTQITAELTTVASTADDAGDPPPGMELALRDRAGKVSVSDGGAAGLPLLSGPAGFADVDSGGRQYRALVADRPEGRVVALVDLAPYRAGRQRLVLALVLAEVVGILASVGVVALLTRRSVRPLTQALALQRRFVADASHELRAPLTVLHTRAQLLAQRLDAGDLPAARTDAHAVVADTRNLAAVVDDLLATATMSFGSTETARVDIGAVAGAVCSTMAPHAESLGVTLSCDLGAQPTGGLEVVGTESALRRVFVALVDNALGHEHPGGTVGVRVRRDGEQVTVTVSDDGSGIDPAVMPNLFDRFSRAAMSQASRQSHGIGLALVREIVEAHGGGIRASSAVGQGASFTVTLPAAPQG